MNCLHYTTVLMKNMNPYQTRYEFISQIIDKEKTF